MTATQKRLAGQRAMAAASRERAAKKRRRIAVLSPVIVLILLAVVLVVVKLSAEAKPANIATGVTDNVATEVTHVPASVLNTVGLGSSSAPLTALSGAALTANGKPEVLFVGAEWCPYCAAERWPLAVALARFGTLTGFGQTASDPNDVFPDTPTLTFHEVTYSSSYITFSGNEIQDGGKRPLDTLSTADRAIYTTLGQGFPFLDIGGRYLVNGAEYSPQILAGKTGTQIAVAIHDPTSAIGRAVDGAANVITAGICASTGNKPASICTTTGVTAAAQSLT